MNLTGLQKQTKRCRRLICSRWRSHQASANSVSPSYPGLRISLHCVSLRQENTGTEKSTETQAFPFSEETIFRFKPPADLGVAGSTQRRAVSHFAWLSARIRRCAHRLSRLLKCPPLVPHQSQRLAAPALLGSQPAASSSMRRCRVTVVTSRRKDGDILSHSFHVAANAGRRMHAMNDIQLDLHGAPIIASRIFNCG